MTTPRIVFPESCRWHASCPSVSIHSFACAVTALLFAAVSSASAEEYGDFMYDVVGDDITIIQYTGSEATVEIPSSIESKPVTIIGSSAFKWYRDLTSVTIPNSVGIVGDYSFEGCTSLTNVTLGNSVSSIGNSAFRDCNSLKNIVIPDSVVTMEYGAFLSCDSLEAFFVGTDNSAFSSTSGVLFNKDQTILLQYPMGKAGAYALPNGVLTVAANAFQGSQGVTDVALPDSVTEIESFAFYVSSLTSLEIGQGLGTIGHRVFENNPDFTNFFVDAGNASFSSVNGVLYDGPTNRLIRCPEGKLGSYSIPNADYIRNLS